MHVWVNEISAVRDWVFWEVPFVNVVSVDVFQLLVLLSYTFHKYGWKSTARVFRSICDEETRPRNEQWYITLYCCVCFKLDKQERNIVSHERNCIVFWQWYVKGKTISYLGHTKQMDLQGQKKSVNDDFAMRFLDFFILTSYNLLDTVF